VDRFWWGVVVALAVNLSSAYLKPRLDVALSRTSSWWRSRSAARIAEQKRVLDELRDPEKQMLVLVEGIVTGFASVQFFALTILFMLLHMDSLLLHVNSSKGSTVGWGGLTDAVTEGFIVVGMMISLKAFLEFHDGLGKLRKAVEVKINDHENPLEETNPPATPR
jgi:hypothetical protein